MTVVFTCADNAGGSGIAQDTVPDVTVTSSTALVTSTGTCKDNAGNVADAATFGPIKIDKTKPVITVVAKTLNGQTYVAGTTTTSRVKLIYTCSDENGGSGIALDTVRDKYATYSHTSVTSSGTCRDAAGNVADPVSFGPIKIVKSNHSDDNDDDCDRD